MALLCNSDHVLAAVRRAATSCANAGLDKIKDRLN
jgi:hypothetical protein